MLIANGSEPVRIIEKVRWFVGPRAALRGINLQSMKEEGNREILFGFLLTEKHFYNIGLRWKPCLLVLMRALSVMFVVCISKYLAKARR